MVCCHGKSQFDQSIAYPRDNMGFSGDHPNEDVSYVFTLKYAAV